MSPYEDLYERRCKSPIGWFEVGKSCVDRIKLSSSIHGEG
ncbi:hypothetical protein MTR67_038790 [Solanum verrucosum]|uniref:Uncharacterized protein n=1 Tax=Solanum verrucosum TaxID=315347 RepID=A0AAF0UGN1_SOLVR|nr:hypothetical protein MTR67_038790 [Solanum verrucosum]